MRRILTISLLMLIIIQGWAATDKYRLTLRDDPSTTVVIGWNQISGEEQTVHYGKTDEGVNYSAYTYSQKPDREIEFKGMNNNFARLTGLEPNTAYYFVIKDSEAVSSRYWFKTLPDVSTERLSFVAGGDSRSNPDIRRVTNQTVSRLRPNAIFFGGDMTSDDTDAEWQVWMDDWQHTISSDNRMYQLVAARGNHEDTNEAVYNLFDTPSSDIYYALTFGGDLISVYTLNTEISMAGDQTNWLTEKLSVDTNVIWKMAQYHEPMRPHTASKGDGTEQYNNWADLFYKNRVKLVMECDAHTVKTTWPIIPSNSDLSDEGFLREDKTGTVYAGEGSWAVTRENNDVKEWTRASGEFNQFKWIFVDKDTIELRTIKTGETNDSIYEVSNEDRFTIPNGLDIWEPDNGSGSVVKILNSDAIAPLVKLSAPEKLETYFSEAQTTSITVDVEDNDSILKVEIFVNDLLYETLTTEPYTYDLAITEGGIYNIIAKVTDNEGITVQTGTKTIYVGNISGRTERRVSATMDDVEEDQSGSISDDSSDLELITDGSDKQIIGLRFTDLFIPDNAKIVNSYIQFTVDESSYSTVSLTIKGESADSAAQFTTSSKNVSNRSTTVAAMSWNPPSWSHEGDALYNQRTPELKTIIEEITARPGWKNGNSVVFIISGTGEKRTAVSYDGSGSEAPLLLIEYVVGDGSDGGIKIDTTNGGFIPSGLNDKNFMDLYMKIYPNPNEGIFNIRIADNKISNNNILTVYNLKGQQLIQKKNIRDNEQIDLREFGTGHYIINLVSGKNIISEKVYCTGSK